MNAPQEAKPNPYQNNQETTPQNPSQGEVVDGAENQETRQTIGQNEQKLKTTTSANNQPLNLPAVDTSAIKAVVQDSSTTDQSTSSPLLADDVDVIEKEWVDRAKAVIKAYENDPNLQEKEINKLQQNYLEKRYNKKITKIDS